MNAVLVVAAVAAALVSSSALRTRVRRDTGIYIGPGSFSANVNVNNTAARPLVAAEPDQHGRDHQEHRPSEVYGVHIGEGNFSPTVNGQGLPRPSALVPKVTVDLSGPNFPAIATQPETPSAGQSQADLEEDQPADSSGPVVYGVNIGDRNFSPNVNVPSIGSPVVNVAKMTSHAVSETFLKVPKFG